MELENQPEKKEKGVAHGYAEELFSDIKVVPRREPSCSLNKNSPYIDPASKFRYFSGIANRLRPYLRSRLADNPEAQDVINQPPLLYLKNLKAAWRCHIEANKSADIFLTQENESVFNKVWAKNQWISVRQMFIDCYETDEQKNLYSGNLKKVIESEVVRLKKKYGLTKEETHLLTTPSVANFYDQYYLDHAKLYLYNQEGIGEDNEQEILKRYHGSPAGSNNR
jgi:hypothetical protein